MTLSGLPDHRQGLCLWFTGLPCAEKSSIALHLAEILKAKVRRVTVLGADVFRLVPCPDLRYPREDRFQSLARLAFVACELVQPSFGWLCSEERPA